MIGALPFSGYAFDLDELNLRYDAVLNSEAEQKAYYKRYNGYKIAWNFTNRIDEFLPIFYRRVERNRKQAVYRLTRTYDLSFLNDLRIDNYADFSQVRNLISGPYWKIGASFMLDWVDRVEGQGITAVFGIWDSEAAEAEENDPANAPPAQRTYRDSLQREIHVRDMIRQCGKWQRMDGDSAMPFITFRSGIVKNVANLVYFNMIVNRY